MSQITNNGTTIQTRIRGRKSFLPTLSRLSDLSRVGHFLRLFLFFDHQFASMVAVVECCTIQKLKIKMKNMMVVLERIIAMLPMSKNIAQIMSAIINRTFWDNLQLICHTLAVIVSATALSQSYCLFLTRLHTKRQLYNCIKIDKIGICPPLSIEVGWSGVLSANRGC